MFSSPATVQFATVVSVCACACVHMCAHACACVHVCMGMWGAPVTPGCIQKVDLVRTGEVGLHTATVREKYPLPVARAECRTLLVRAPREPAGRKWSRAPDRGLERALGDSGACPPPRLTADVYGCDPCCSQALTRTLGLALSMWLPERLSIKLGRRFPASYLPGDRFQGCRTCPLAALPSASRLWTWHSDKALQACGPASIPCAHPVTPPE